MTTESKYTLYAYYQSLIDSSIKMSVNNLKAKINSANMAEVVFTVNSSASARTVYYEFVGNQLAAANSASGDSLL